MNIEPLITRRNALYRVMLEFTPHDQNMLSILSQSVEKLQPILSRQDFELLDKLIHEHINIISRLYEAVIDLCGDVETLIKEAKNELS